jgi:hypothetical protein
LGFFSFLFYDHERDRLFKSIRMRHNKFSLFLIKNYIYPFSQNIYISLFILAIYTFNVSFFFFKVLIFKSRVHVLSKKKKPLSPATVQNFWAKNSWSDVIIFSPKYIHFEREWTFSNKRPKIITIGSSNSNTTIRGLKATNSHQDISCNVAQSYRSMNLFKDNILDGPPMASFLVTYLLHA